MPALFEIEEKIGAARDGNDGTRRVGERVHGFVEGLGFEVVLPVCHFFREREGYKMLGGFFLAPHAFFVSLRRGERKTNRQRKPLRCIRVDTVPLILLMCFQGE